MSHESIMEFCQSARDKAHPTADRTEIGSASLSDAGFDITQFTFAEFRASCVGLCFTMTYRGMNMFIGKDQVIFWDTLGRLLLDPPSLYFSEIDGKPFPEDDQPMRDLFVTTIKTATHEWEMRQSNPISKWRWFQSPVGLPAGRFAAAAYLTYPLLEAVLKRYLCNYLTRDGHVLKPFSPPHRKYKANARCSSIKDMLWLLLYEESSTDLGNDLQGILDHISFLYPNDDPLAVISEEWRNPAMHGADCVPTAYGIVLNLVLLIAMSTVTAEMTARIGP